LPRGVQAVLAQLERPLLCSSIRAADQMSGALPDAVALLDQFQPRGLDFVVDDGRQVGSAAPTPPPLTPPSSASGLCMHTQAAFGPRAPPIGTRQPGWRMPAVAEALAHRLHLLLRSGDKLSCRYSSQ